MHARPILTAALVLANAFPAMAESEGAQLYLRYCATCHGLDAAGNGPMAPNLVLQPPDLTMLAARNDGSFPVFRVVSRIDGRDPLIAHGSPMPVYGDLFDTRMVTIRDGTGQPILTNAPIADLVAWLREIQVAAMPDTTQQ